MKLNEETYSSLSAEITAILRGTGTDDEKIAAILAAADSDFNLSDIPDNIEPEQGESSNNTLDNLDDNGDYASNLPSKGKNVEAGDDEIDLNDDTKPDTTEPDDSNDTENQDKFGNGKESTSTSGGRDSGGSKDTSSGNQDNDSYGEDEFGDSGDEFGEDPEDNSDGFNRVNKGGRGGKKGNNGVESGDIDDSEFDDSDFGDIDGMDAQEAADAAQDAADAAKQAADTAQDAADAAQEAADAAQEAADAAQETADDIKNNGGSSSEASAAQEEADTAQEAADAAQDAADKAQQAADAAQEAANAAQDAADAAQDAADNGDKKGAKENSKKAKDAAKDAKKSAKEAADKTRESTEGADDDAAQQAEDAADAAQDAAKQSNNKNKDKANNGSKDSKDQNNSGNDDTDSQDGQSQGNEGEQEQDDDSTSMSEPDDSDPRRTKSDFEKGEEFGKLLGGLLYGYGGDPDILMSELHFDDIYELPELPHIKVKNIHNINFNESLLEAEADENVLRDLRAALLDTNEKRRLTKILSVLSRRKNGQNQPISPTSPAPEPVQPIPPAPATPVQPPIGNVEWQNVKIARADGDFDGTGDLFGENHVMTDDMRSQIEDARSAKLKKTLFDNESPFSSEDGLLKAIETMTGRTFGKNSQPEDEDKARKGLERTKERLRANRKGFIDWCQELRKFLKGLRMSKAKTDMRTRTLLDPTAPALFNRDPMVEAGNKLVIYLDVSGSVVGRPGVLSQVIAEIKKIARECKFKKLDLICFDQGILDQYCLIDQTPAEIQNPGWTINRPPGGGTVFDSVYKHMFKYYALKKSTSAVLIFSDSDATASSNIFSNWASKPANRSMAVQIKTKLGKKCMFIGVGVNPSALSEFKVATIPGTKVILVDGDDFVMAMRSAPLPNNTNESNNNKTIMNKYYEIDNLNEAFARTKKPAAQKQETPVVEPAAEPAEPVIEPGAEPIAEPAAEPKSRKKLTTKEKLAAIKRDEIVDDNLSGGELFEKNIDDWMKSVFGMWKLKKVIGTQNMLAESQTYCISLINGIYKININNELKPKANGKAYGGVYSAQAVTMPPKAWLPANMEVGKSIEIASLRGNLKVSNFTGAELPSFFPKRIIGNTDGNGGNLFISNCTNLNTTKNFPVSVEGKVIIEGEINITEDELEEYNDRLIDFEAQRRAKAGLPPIDNPERKVFYD